MDTIILILKQYWQIILFLLLTFLTFILQLIKKKPVKVVDTIKEWIAEFVPFCVKEAEEKFGAGKGVNKKEYVVEKMLVMLKNTFGVTEDIAISYLSFINTMIEVVLGTPQKKD